MFVVGGMTAFDACSFWMLLLAVWGNDAIPFVVQYAGCQMCRGHSENGSWHDGGVRKCHDAFLEAYTFGDNQVRNTLKRLTRSYRLRVNLNTKTKLNTQRTDHGTTAACESATTLSWKPTRLGTTR